MSALEVPLFPPRSQYIQQLTHTFKATPLGSEAFEHCPSCICLVELIHDHTLARGRSSCSRAIEEEASSHQGATSPHAQRVLPTQTAPSTHFAPTTQSQNEVVAQLVLVLMAIHEAIAHLAGDQPTQAPISTSAPAIVELVLDEPVQGVMPKNAVNLSVARRLVAQSEEPTLCFTKNEIEAMFKKEQKRATTASTNLNLKPPYSYKVAAKQYPLEYKVPKFQNFDRHKGNTIEHMARFFDSMRPHSRDLELCLREFSKSLTDRAYTKYLSLKPGKIQDRAHMVSTFNTKVFFA